MNKLIPSYIWLRSLVALLEVLIVIVFGRMIFGYQSEAGKDGLFMKFLVEWCFYVSFYVVLRIFKATYYEVVAITK